MERMLRKKKDNSDYEIDRELTWKFAIEKNAEYQDRIGKLEEENKKLKERIEVLYEFIERNDKLVDEVIDEEDLDKLNRYIYIDDDLVDRTLESED